MIKIICITVIILWVITVGGALCLERMHSVDRKIKKGCTGCMHDGRSYNDFPCDECLRALNGDADMYVKKH